MYNFCMTVKETLSKNASYKNGISKPTKTFFIILSVIFGIVAAFTMIFYVSGDRTGSVASDGHTSTATGSGAGSHHGGVDHWLVSRQDVLLIVSLVFLFIGLITLLSVYIADWVIKGKHDLLLENWLLGKYRELLKIDGNTLQPFSVKVPENHLKYFMKNDRYFNSLNFESIKFNNVSLSDEAIFEKHCNISREFELSYVGIDWQDAKNDFIKISGFTEYHDGSVNAGVGGRKIMKKTFHDRFGSSIASHHKKLINIEKKKIMEKYNTLAIKK